MVVQEVSEGEFERGYRSCACGLRNVLEAGADYPKESWIKCGQCKCHVVDPKKIEYKNP